MQKSDNTSKLVLDPRTKLFVFAILSFGVVANYDLLVMISAGVFISALYALSGNTMGAAKIAVLYVLMALFAAFQGYIAEFLGQNVIMVLLYLIQSLFIIFMPTVSFAIYFMQTTQVSTILSSLEKLRISQNISIPIVIMLRFFPSLRESYVQIKNAMRMRGIRSGFLGIIRNPLLAMEYILIPLMFAASNMSDELAASAYTRGAGFTGKKVRYLDSEFGILDYLAFAFALYYLAIVIKVRFL